MKLIDRLMSAFKPQSHDATMDHYIPAVQYADTGVANSIWRSDLEKRLVDWRGDTGRVYDQQVLTAQGGLMFALKAVPTAGLGGTGATFGQYITPAVAGFAGRAAVIDETSTAAEFEDVQS